MRWLILFGWSLAGCSTGSVAAVFDAGADARPVVLTPDPGLVTCGSSTCTTGGDHACCLDSVNDAGVCGSALPGNPCPGDIILSCDEPADCMGLACCRYAGTFSSFCSATSCEAGALCKQDSDCTAGSCVAQTCAGRRFGYCGVFDPGCH